MEITNVNFKTVLKFYLYWLLFSTITAGLVAILANLFGMMFSGGSYE